MRKGKPKFKKERPPDQNAVDADWRLFIALPMPDVVQERIARIVGVLAERELPVRWVAAESAHLTLHFLGETAPERAELVRMGLGSAVTRHAPFSMRTADVGVFPDFRKPRVIWQGLTGQTDRLAALHNDIGRQLVRLEFEVDNRRFHPHVTLGRVRDNPPPSLGADVQRALNDRRVAALIADAAIEITATEVLLVRSFLERGGSRHVPIDRYPLRG
jgi:2'-5' RNA ligase